MYEGANVINHFIFSNLFLKKITRKKIQLKTTDYRQLTTKKVNIIVDSYYIPPTAD